MDRSTRPFFRFRRLLQTGLWLLLPLLAACGGGAEGPATVWRPVPPQWSGDLQLEVLDSSRIRLRWPVAQDESTPPHELRYRIELEPASAAPAQVHELRGVTAATLGGLVDARRWRLSVRPRDLDGLDGASLGPLDFELPDAAATPVVAVTDVVLAVTGTSLSLQWQNLAAVAAVRCALDGQVTLPCESPWMVSGLAPGPHLVSLQPLAADGAPGAAWFALAQVAGSGNESGSGAGTPRAPRLELLHVPANPSWTPTPVVAWWIDDPAARSECRLDAAADWQACESPLLPGGAPGRRRLELRTLDPWGEPSPVQVVEWTQADCDLPGAWCTESGRDASPLLDDDGPAGRVGLQWPGGIAVAGDGRIAVADGYGARIWLFRPDGTALRVAGDGRSHVFDPDGPTARSRAIGVAWGVVFDGTRIVFSDVRHSCLRAVDLESGQLSTVAGACGSAGFADGTAAAARFFNPRGLVRTADGAIYIADGANHRIRRLKNGSVSTVAGTGTAGFGGDGGAATLAQLNFPLALAVGPDGSALYIADAANHRVRQIDFSQSPPRMQTVIGDGSEVLVDGEPATATGLPSPYWVAYPEGGELHAATGWGQGAVVRRTADGRLRVRVAADSPEGSAGDGGPLADALLRPAFAAAAWGPDLVLAGRRALRVVHGERVHALAGPAGDQAPAQTGGPAVTGTLLSPQAAVAGADGTLWLLDAGSETILRQREGRLLDRFGPELQQPRDLVLDPDRGQLYVSEAGRHRVLAVSLADGSSRVLAGTGVPGVHDGAGLAAETPLHTPWGLWREGRELWIVDRGGHCVRRVDLDDGSIGTHAGACGSPGNTDAADPRNARFTEPNSLTGDGSGTLWLFDAGNHRIRRLRTGGTATVVGSGADGQMVAGAGTATPMRATRGLAWDARGRRVLIGQVGAIWGLTVDNGQVARLAGAGEDARGFHSGHGRALAARMLMAAELSADAEGLVRIPESASGRVMRWRTP